MEKESIELVYIGDSNRFFKNGQSYYFNFHDNEMGCIDETGGYHDWSIKEAFKSFTTPDNYFRMFFYL